MTAVSRACSYFPCSSSYPSFKDFKELQIRHQIITIIAVTIITVLSLGILTFPTVKFLIKKFSDDREKSSQIKPPSNSSSFTSSRIQSLPPIQILPPEQLRLSIQSSLTSLREQLAKQQEERLIEQQVALRKLNSISSLNQEACLREMEADLSLSAHRLDLLSVPDLIQLIYAKADERSYIDGNLHFSDNGDNYYLYSVLLAYLKSDPKNMRYLPELLMRKHLADFDADNPDGSPSLIYDLEYIMDNTPKDSLLFKWASLRHELFQKLSSISRLSLAQEEFSKVVIDVYKRYLNLTITPTSEQELRECLYQQINSPETKEKCLELIHLMSHNPLIVLKTVDLSDTATISHNQDGLERLHVVSSYTVRNPSDSTSMITISDKFTI